MLGAIIGDIIGSVYEFDNYRSKDFAPLFHAKAFYTDDTVCTVAVADALVNSRDPAQAIKEWGVRYWANGGWGHRFAIWLRSDSLAPYNSYGNGAAMRVSAAGLLANSLTDAVTKSNRVTAVTHNHPEGMKGAAATASAIYLARTGSTQAEIRDYIEKEFGYDLSRSIDEIRPGYKFNESCQETVPQALTCVLEATSFEDAMRNAISIGGDSDTIAAIAGGVAEALFGIPVEIATKGWSYLPQDMREVLTHLYAMAGGSGRVEHQEPRISVVRGDIVKQTDCDAIVNSANENLRAGSGVCGAIYSAAGPALEPCSMHLAPLALGEAVATPGFNLANQLIIHTRGPKYLLDPDPVMHLSAAMRNTLLCAEGNQVVKLAVPAISMGVYAYPPAEAIPVLVQVAREMADSLVHLKEIRFVVTNAGLQSIFEQEIAKALDRS
jgi:ADP-ribosyl-[dinitrogen reductase] hydrolase